ncbi:hypothetical protein [Pseudomonas sp. LB3P31]
MFDKFLSFTATMTISSRPVALVSGHTGPAMVATQLKKTEPMQFRFYHHVAGGYQIQVDEGQHKGKWIGIKDSEGALQICDSPNTFSLKSVHGANLTLHELDSEVSIIHLQTISGWYVQQRLEAVSAFDDQDVLYNFLHAVTKKDRGNGTYLAMVEDAWVSKPLSYNPPPSHIILNIKKREID